jgi:hypothetical protein
MGTVGVRGDLTTTNHVAETERVLGIEAARHAIMHEIRETMSAHGMAIDERHTMLLADCMTYKVGRARRRAVLEVVWVWPCVRRTCVHAHVSAAHDAAGLQLGGAHKHTRLLGQRTHGAHPQHHATHRQYATRARCWASRALASPR